MDLSIIIVSWNVKDLLRENLKSIYNETSGIDFEVFVIDNNSGDGSAQMVRDEFTQVKLIANDFNAGFAKANNQGIKQSCGRYVLLYNPDMRSGKDTFSKMVDWMDKTVDAGVAACKLITSEGEIVPHVRHYPTVWDQLTIVLKISHLFPQLLNKYLWKDFDYTKEAVVDSVRGSFFMIRRELLNKLGGLDERYFIWFEEVDFCRQTVRAGYKVYYTPVVECIDYVGKSFSQVARYKTQKMFTKSMLTYFKKWHPGWRYGLIYVTRPLGLISVWIVEKIGIRRDLSKIKN